ncbi:hypothetical protein CJ030_MR3G015773 [Morella rubra]|uniref:Uncharacterized protein n=1 Tax=Morella rubra TaxID=262757 RepID=A0A6A1WCG3_9ROSI|nr:hypothetical protein CJ030_MR3G015773 [Morella rubra]
MATIRRQPTRQNTFDKKESREKKCWFNRIRLTRQCGHAAHGPVILPLLRAGGDRCTVKPASRFALRSRSHLTQAFAQIRQPNSQLGAGEPVVCTTNPAERAEPLFQHLSCPHSSHKLALPSSASYTALTET